MVPISGATGGGGNDGSGAVGGSDPDGGAVASGGSGLQPAAAAVAAASPGAEASGFLHQFPPLRAEQLATAYITPEDFKVC